MVGRCGYPRCMEQDPPLVRDVFPDLTAELTALMEEEDRELAIVVRDVRLLRADRQPGEGNVRSL